ncbi:unnamed protein product [Effrenium voratum]|uniref:Uncharacterized protein n=1 Tax=Effrenium voratum TaxID=2562239 RepID=A0AA36IG21_9DINO|nr:unnamed protein product [Effrenium voratum]CAJ1438291.1 unnamed protein product [Effrenium voratum]
MHTVTVQCESADSSHTLEQFWSFLLAATPAGCRSLQPVAQSPQVKRPQTLLAMAIPVTLHIYHVSTDSRVGAVNEYLEAMGTGAFHAGVEVNGKEWSYGYSPDGSGVFSCSPKGCKAHVYKDSLEMGECQKSSAEIEAIIQEMEGDWPGFDYDLLRKNCCLFSKALVEKLGVGPVPSWVTNLAAAGATLHDGILKGKEIADKAAIMAKAKAGEIDEKYNISGTVSAAGKEVLMAAGRFDEQYKVRERTFAAAVAVQAKAGEMTEAAKAKAAEMHKEMDKDGDGQVSLEEMRAYLKAHANKAHAAVDKDGDGKITFDEAKSFATERAGQCGCEACTVQ